jgi:ATP-binding cassette, subfamily A (ABC1), member 3
MPQFMYESILRTATHDPTFSFKLRSTPFPLTTDAKFQMLTVNAGIIVFMTSIAYSVVITAVVSYTVVERTEGLKHLQTISGMQLKAYWVANFLFDSAKFYVTILVTIAIFFGFKMGYEAAWLTYLLLPVAILPFTYVSSFVFTVDSAAQTFTMFLHFMVICLVSTVVYSLRFAPSLEILGDHMNIWLRLIPTYCLSQSVYFDSVGEILADFRAQDFGMGPDLSKDTWHAHNIAGDIMFECGHFVVWSCVLALIETGILKKIKFLSR